MSHSSDPKTPTNSQLSPPMSTIGSPTTPATPTLSDYQKGKSPQDNKTSEVRFFISWDFIFCFTSGVRSRLSTYLVIHTPLFMVSSLDALTHLNVQYSRFTIIVSLFFKHFSSFYSPFFEFALFASRRFQYFQYF